jgi:hypothetical protein
MSNQNIINQVETDFDWENKTWDVVDKYFKQNGIMVAHHLESFDYFMSKQLPSIVREKDFNPVRIYNKDTKFAYFLSARILSLISLVKSFFIH